VYQFNALDYSANGKFPYSNDASLLLPTNVGGGELALVTYAHRR